MPGITFYTPTYRRPKALAACMASVAEQTAVAQIEHVVIPDYLGIGVGGMFGAIPRYASAVHGEYVHVLADDDVLAAPDVVARLLEFAAWTHQPPLIVAQVDKDGRLYPHGPAWPPRLGAIDLGCLVTRADVWRDHVASYGRRYEGDFDFASALAAAGHPAMVWHGVLLRGAVMRGASE